MLSEEFCEPDGSRSEVQTDRDFSIRALGNPEKGSTIRQHQKRRNANRGTAVHLSRAIYNASERCVTTHSAKCIALLGTTADFDHLRTAAEVVGVSNLLEQLIDHLAG